MIKRMCILKAKLKSASKERILMWKEYFKNLLGKSPKLADRSITKIMNCQRDIKLGQFTQEEFSVVQTKIKCRKATGLKKIPLAIWKIRKFDDLLLRFFNAEYKQNTIERWIKSCILPFLKKSDFGISKSYKGITHSSIAETKVYNALLLNRIEREIFAEIDPQHHRYLQSIESSKELVQKISWQHCCLLISQWYLIPCTDLVWFGFLAYQPLLVI